MFSDCPPPFPPMNSTQCAIPLKRLNYYSNEHRTPSRVGAAALSSRHMHVLKGCLTINLTSANHIASCGSSALSCQWVTEIRHALPEAPGPHRSDLLDRRVCTVTRNNGWSLTEHLETEPIPSATSLNLVNAVSDRWQSFNE